MLIPKHFKAPKFLEELKVALGEDGNVSLECKVIGIPQPALTWFKDDRELRAGDLHQLTAAGAGEACVFGRYRCQADNCMGTAFSEATLIGIGKGNRASLINLLICVYLCYVSEDESMTEDSVGSKDDVKAAAANEAAEAAAVDDLLEEIDVSASFAATGDGSKSVKLSMADVPDISASDAQQIVQMFAEELAETISGKGHLRKNYSAGF